MKTMSPLAAAAAIFLACATQAAAQASNSGVFNPVYDAFDVNVIRDLINNDPELIISSEGKLDNTNHSFFMVKYKQVPVLMTLICNETGSCKNAMLYANYGSALSSAGVDINTSNRGSLFGWHVAENSGRVGFKHALLAKGITGETVKNNIKLFAAAYVLSYDRLKGSANTISYTPRDNAGIDANHLPESDLTRIDVSAQLSDVYGGDFDVETFVDDPQQNGEVRKVMNDFLSSR